MSGRQIALFLALDDYLCYEKNIRGNYDKIPLSRGEVTYYPHFFAKKISDRLFKQLKEEIAWQQDYITLFGKTNPVPRLTAWYGDAGKSYTYSGILMNPQPWIEPLLYVKNAIEPFAGVKFNSVLLNLYRHGKDGVAWHSDDESELGDNPIIASVSFGGTRRFMFKPKDKNSQEKHELELTHGSLLLMGKDTQKYWLHQIPKTSKSVSPRINLTFRFIY